MMKGRMQAAEREHDLAMRQAWFTAAMPLMKHFPDREDLMIASASKAEAVPTADAAKAGAMLDALLTMQAMGVPMDIKRLN